MIRRDYKWADQHKGWLSRLTLFTPVSSIPVFAPVFTTVVSQTKLIFDVIRPCFFIIYCLVAARSLFLYGGTKSISMLMSRATQFSQRVATFISNLKMRKKNH